VSGNGERHARCCICCRGERLLSTPAILMPFLAKRIFNHEPTLITEDWGLRDIPNGTAYSLCNTLECADCGVLFLDYRFSDYELELLYKDYRGEKYNSLRIRFEPSYSVTAMHYTGRAAYLEDVETVLAPYLPERPKVLDWGGGSGVNSPFRFKSKSLHVYDISGVAVVDEGETVSFDALYQNNYDLVACLQVLEHVSYPLNVLKQIALCLGPKSILYLEVPFEELFKRHEQSEFLGQFKRYWHEHVNFFSPASLRAMVASCSLEILDEKILPVSVGFRNSAVQMFVCRLTR